MQTVHWPFRVSASPLWHTVPTAPRLPTGPRSLIDTHAGKVSPVCSRQMSEDSIRSLPSKGTFWGSLSESMHTPVGRWWLDSVALQTKTLPQFTLAIC